MMKNKNCVGIMQGRLSPPVNGKIQAFPWGSWMQEFYLAKEIGLDLIDWIVEADRFDENPLLTLEGEKTIKEIVSKTGVQVGAVCADYFMDCPLIRCSHSDLKERMDILDFLIDRLNIFGIKYLEIPFVDNSAIRDDVELEQIVEIIRPRLNRANNAGVILAFETSLPPDIFKDFLLKLNHPAARANYDMGNSASLGYNQKQEIETYGEWVATVHIKDRLFKGGNVPLGEGNTDFMTCFSMLKVKMYTGPYIFETPRSNDEVESAKKNMIFLNQYLKG